AVCGWPPWARRGGTGRGGGGRRGEGGFVGPPAARVPPRRRTQIEQPTRASETRVLRVHQRPDRDALRDGAYHFFATTAFNAWMSSVCSATMCFSRRFSSSSCLRRCISLSSIPPYFAFQR